MPLGDAHAQPPWLFLKQQIIAACTRLVAKTRNVYVHPLVGKTYSMIYLWAAGASQVVPAPVYVLPT